MKTRYRQTTVKDKRSIVRSLNTFSEQYEYIYCDESLESEVDLDNKSLTLYFTDEESDFYTKIIYCRSEANIELTKYKNIIEAIENLISINRKKELKKELKELVEKTLIKRFSMDKNIEPIATFFDKNKMNTRISYISEIVGDKKYAIKIYNQIKNRIQFKNVGIYKNNSPSQHKANKIKLRFRNRLDIFNNQIAFIKQHLWLFKDTQLKTIQRGLKDGNFNFLYEHHSENIAEEWIEHYYNLTASNSNFYNYLYPTIEYSLKKIFTKYELLKYKEVYTKKRNIVQINSHIQKTKQAINKRLKNKKLADNCFRELKRYWLEIDRVLNDEVFYYELIHIYYFNIENFKMYDGIGENPIHEFYGEFVYDLVNNTRFKDFYYKNKKYRIECGTGLRSKIVDKMILDKQKELENTNLDPIDFAIKYGVVTEFHTLFCLSLSHHFIS